MTLTNILLYSCIPFVIVTIYMGTRNGYYNTDEYEGDGCAHDVKR